MQPVIERARMSREEWLESLARICLADVRKMFDSCGNPLPITSLGANEAAATAAFEVSAGTSNFGRRWQSLKIRIPRRFCPMGC